MHLLIVIAFGLLIWRSEPQPISPLVHDPALCIVLVTFQPLLWWAAARLCSAYASRRLRAKGDGRDAAQLAYHRASLLLRILVFAGFAGDLFLTRWPQIVDSLKPIPPWSGIADLMIISPLFLALVAVWHAQFPVDQALREHAARFRRWEAVHLARVWTVAEYLSFNVRHQILTVAVPMTIIVVAYRLCGYHRSRLVDTLLFPWVPDAVLALVAAAVFIFSPWLLKTLWTTATLKDGPLRRRLEQVCRRTGLRCRDILVWDSYGMMINAAVMGVFAPFRYVLLSDGLLDGLNEDEIEAVFGHETGHVRHHHMQYFLLFALVSVLLVSGVMEVVIRLTESPASRLKLNETALQGIGLGLMAVVWGTAFGWLSRRFERQADVFGAHCVSSAGPTCNVACGVHLSDGGIPASGHAVCVGAAKVFVAALDRVAALNGIPHEERNWRHSSIASRMRFLMAQAGDPAAAEGFHRLIVKVKRVLWATAVVGLIITAVYCVWRPAYQEIIIQNTLKPLSRLETLSDGYAPHPRGKTAIGVPQNGDQELR
ncbi:MAG: M48 family metallopeptidase [Planctomycetota bacterium]